MATSLSYPQPAYATGPTAISRATIMRTAFFIFMSTTPALGTIGLIGTAIGGAALLIAFNRPNNEAVMMLTAFLLLILPITIYDLFVSVTTQFTTLSFVAIPLLLATGFILSQSAGEFEYLDVYERAFFYLSIPASILFLIYVIFPGVVYTLPEYEFRETFNRTAVFLNIQMNPDPVLRNAGFASEPGFYQLLVNAALYARLRRIGRPDKISIYYLIVALSTLSTAGLVISCFLISLKFDLKYRLFILLIAAAFYGFLQEFVMQEYNSKVANDAVFGPRFIPTLNALQVYSENLLGIGAVEYSDTYFYRDIGSWDSYSQVALRYGTPGLFGFAFFLFSLAKRHIVLAGICVLSFITSPIWFFPAVAAFYFPGRAEGGRVR